MKLLGYPGGFIEKPVRLVVQRTDVHDDVLLHSCVLLTPENTSVPATLLAAPDISDGKKRQGILYCHAHGNRYDIGRRELVSGRPAILDPPLGISLAQSGSIVLCIDMPGFGDRQSEGTECELAKAALWEGRSPLGDMLRDQAYALAALRSLPEVDPSRIGTVGISMGATLAYFLAALDPSVERCAHLCAFANMAPLIQTRAHDLHGIYMTVPGLLPNHDMADVAALISPRPQLVCTGLRDPLTPEAAAAPAQAQLRESYEREGALASLRLVTDENAGHEETQEFRREVLRFFDASEEAGRVDRS